MEQNEQVRLSALSNASMLSAIGVTLMYGLSLLLALLAPASVAVGVVSLIGLILWLVGIYNTSSAFKGFNAAVAASFERLFKAQLVIVIAVVAYWVLIILIPQILGYKGAKASIA
ncbi:unknown [Prevotella sp. CAG:873]|nr:unknown [Prevotella sp. CAG:873]